MKKEQSTEIQRSVNTVEVLNKIQEQLSGFSREPFRKELSRFLCFSPSDEAVQEHANKSPDRWSQAVAILGRLSGITDKVDDATPYSPHNFQNLSLSEKRKMLTEFESKIKDELKMELERRGAIIDPDTLEKVSILELNNGDGKKERQRYPFEDAYHNRPKSTMGD